MANTLSLVKDVYPSVLKEASRIIGTDLTSRKLKIGDPLRSKKFDGVSSDGKIVAFISTSSGYSKTGKLPTGKINKIYLYCFMMNLTKAERKILLFTNEEFFRIISKETEGFLNGFELLHLMLPPELQKITDKVTKEASNEMV